MKPIHEQEWERIGNHVEAYSADGDAIASVVVTANEDSDKGPLLDAIAAAPDMARAGLAIYARVEEAARAMPGARTADDLAAMDTSVTVPASLIRDLFAAMRKGGVQP